MWDEKTLYKDSTFFGIGMSSWQKMELWSHLENVMDMSFCSNIYMLEYCEVMPDDLFY